MVVLLVLVAAAVAIFLSSDARLSGILPFLQQLLHSRLVHSAIDKGHTAKSFNQQQDGM